jgi:hypothetical protein
VAAPQQKVFVASGTGPARVLVFRLARRPNRLQAKNLRVSRLFYDRQSHELPGNGEKMTAALMEEFPPSADRLVTLANWRKAPFSAWGFRNVRRLIPTADVAASGHAMELETSLEEIGHIELSSHDG